MNEETNKVNIDDMLRDWVSRNEESLLAPIIRDILNDSEDFEFKTEVAEDASEELQDRAKRVENFMNYQYKNDPEFKHKVDEEFMKAAEKVIEELLEGKPLYCNKWPDRGEQS